MTRTLVIVIVALAMAASAVWAPSALAAGVPGSSEKGTLVHVVTRWDSNCSGSTRDSWDNMVRAWYNDITNPFFPPWGHGAKAWSKDGFYHNGSRVDSEFTDDRWGKAWLWGNDDADDNADEPDALMVALHGGESSGNQRWYGKVRVNEAGTGNCYAWQGHVVLGDYDLEFLHLSSCHSMCKDVWWPEWSSSFDGLHQIDGFHGIMWISTAFNNDYRDFADDGFDISIADSWIENMYKNNASNSYDQCPVARGVGTSRSNLWSRMGNEEYDWVYSDPNNPSWNGVIYINGCDPKSDPPL